MASATPPSGTPRRRASQHRAVGELAQRLLAAS
jgi:hypothetical protein